MPFDRDDCKVYVGDLGNDATTDELEKAFKGYGKLKKVWVARKPPGFAFVEYENPRDAEDAAKGMDGKMLCGRKVKVELSHGRSRWPQGRPPQHLLRRPAPNFVEDRRNESFRGGRFGDRGRGDGPVRGRGQGYFSNRSHERMPIRRNDFNDVRRLNNRSRSRSRSPLGNGARNTNGGRSRTSWTRSIDHDSPVNNGRAMKTGHV